MAARDGDASEKRVCVGAIAGAFGVHGDARVKAFTADPRAIAAYGPVTSEDGARRFELTVGRELKPGLLAARLSGVETREEAEALKGLRLYVPRSALPDTEDADEFYYADLIGMQVESLDGEPLGRVTAVHDHGAGDLLEIDRPGGGKRPLLPFTREAVPHIDEARGVIIADPPSGVFDDDAAEDPGGAGADSTA